MEINATTISVVIPTCNRKESLLRTIDSLYKQTYAIHEIIIIDASDVSIKLEELINENHCMNVSVLYTKPSVCLQRNMGIKKAKGEYIFLLDDDNIIDANYIETIINFNKQNPEAIAVSGIVMERKSVDEWQYTFPEVSFLGLLWIYIFQLGIWADLKEMKGTIFTSIPLYFLKSYYNKKGNTLSKAGWPVLTNFNKPYFRTQIYGLGVSIIKKTWLENNLYEEKLERNGMGDNYGVAINLTEEQGVFVLSDVRAYHYKEISNRLSSVEAYYQRVVALHFFIIIKNNLSSSRKWLFWSLVGNFIFSVIKFNFKFGVANLKLMKIILLNKNPLLNTQSRK